MRNKALKAYSLTQIIRESQAAMMRGEELSIKGRDDLMTATVKIEYEIGTRTGKLFLAELCSVNYAGCIRLFTDIDPSVKRIEVLSGDKLDGVYFKNRGEWSFSGFPFD